MKTAEDLPKLTALYDAFETLRGDNARLRQELSRRDAKAAVRGTYERKEMGNAVVLVHVEPDGKHGPPCCPKCEDPHGEPLPLQRLMGPF